MINRLSGVPNLDMKRSPWAQQINPYYRAIIMKGVYALVKFINSIYRNFIVLIRI